MYAYMYILKNSLIIQIVMQKLISKISGKIQMQNKLQHIKTLHKNAALQSCGAALIAGGLVSWLDVQPLGLIFFLLFCFCCIKQFCNPCIELSPDVSNYLNELQDEIVEFRRTKPAIFCIISSCFFSGLALIGDKGVGVMILLIFVKVFVVWLRIRKFEGKALQIKINYKKLAWVGDNESELNEEFLPEESDENMIFLERASNLSLLTSPTDEEEHNDDKSDEIPSELLIPDPIPEINENSTDDDQDDLLPIESAPKSEISSYTAATEFVTHSEPNETIEFKKSYFKRDSSISTTSSSSEENLSKGLQFPDHTAIDNLKEESSAQDEIVLPQRAQPLLVNNNMYFPSLMSNFVQRILASGIRTSDAQSSRRVVLAPESSDESEFEILEKDDFQI